MPEKISNMIQGSKNAIFPKPQPHSLLKSNWHLSVGWSPEAQSWESSLGDRETSSTTQICVSQPSFIKLLKSHTPNGQFPDAITTWFGGTGLGREWKGMQIISDTLFWDVRDGKAWIGVKVAPTFSYCFPMMPQAQGLFLVPFRVCHARHGVWHWALNRHLLNGWSI